MNHCIGLNLDRIQPSKIYAPHHEGVLGSDVQLHTCLTPELQVRGRPASRTSGFAHEEGAPKLTEYKKARQ